MKKDEHRSKIILITGGAGFIGTNLAHRLLTDGNRVIIYDNLSRAGSERNLRWLIETHGKELEVRIADVRDSQALTKAVKGVDQVFHFAAQVAVTKSLTNPIEDFEINLRGTLNLLEILRTMPNPPSLLYTSTNKVYGNLSDIPLRATSSRYEPVDPQVLGASKSLDFYSPYGCSKGGADQYVIDYARSFGIKATVFRMSCIYGPHQYGTEDQGWVAHFLISALSNDVITIYGDGLQVRDILFVEDLIDAMILAQEKIELTSKNAYSIGGGISRTLSLVELIDLISSLHKRKPQIRFSDWRTGDQKYYVSDISEFNAVCGWEPRVGIKEGVEILYRWIVQSRKNEFFRIEKEPVV
jgi:CDP-paratose 2-epimerase